MADGSVISTNDWQPVPTTFDGVLGSYELDFGRLSAWVIKFAQYDNGMTANAFTGTVATSGSRESDPEADAYGLSFDLKRMPEWLKMVNVHVIENTKSSTPGAFYSPALAANPTSRMGQNILRYGVAVGGAAGMFDYKADFAGMNGNYYCSGGYDNPLLPGIPYCGGVGGAMTAMSANGYMAQGELGLNFPEFMKARIFAKYHYDTGDNDSSTNQSAVKTYDPYFYDRHAGSGNMEVIGWGNLTFYTAGLSVMPTDQTNVSLQYFYFQKTEGSGRINPGRFGDMMQLTSPNSSSLGQEVDLIAEHKYDGGFTMYVSGGLFMPGTSVKDGMTDDPLRNALPATVPRTNRGDLFTQVMVQGRMGF
jgi:hypothetical protein